jgi:hypothetical protein
MMNELRTTSKKGRGQKKKKKWDLGESNPVLLLNCLTALLASSRKVALHHTPGPFPSFDQLLDMSWSSLTSRNKIYWSKEN